MKRYLLPALLLFCLLLCACGGDGGSAPEMAPPAPEQSAATPEPSPEPLLPLEISEVMSSNKSTICDEEGLFPDWVELHNTGEEALSLEGCVLCCGGKQCGLPGIQLAPDAYTLVFCSRERTGFSVSSEGEQLRLLDPDGRELDRVTLPALETDCSWTPEGVSRWPTPGRENSPRGYEELQDALLPRELAVGEVVVRSEKGDWVELVNTGSETLRLEDYYLSDKEKERTFLPLPAGELAPGERKTISLERAGFSLNAGRDQLYLSRSDGLLVDYVNLHDIPLGGSLGRLEGKGGFWYFPVSTPGKENGEGFRRVSAKPESSEPDGVFENVEQVTVTLRGTGEIYYTTDGSLPTAESERYTGPLTLTETGVIRAVCVEEGALPGKALSLSYVINEHHSLPVTSLVCDPQALFGSRGIYDNTAVDTEQAGALMFYDGEGSFSIDCGIKPHGATSRLTQPKKSMKVVFRDCYEGNLNFDLFHNGVTDFASILLRAPREEQNSTFQRDCLLHTLAAEAFPALPTQDYRFAVLYINGQYWGIYTLREAHSATHYANHYGLDPDSVLQYRSGWGSETGFDETYLFAINNDLRSEENYRRVTERLDLDSVIGWAIIEAFSGNIDGHCSNMRFYYTLDDGVMHFGLVDLDATLRDFPGFDTAYLMGYKFNFLLSSLTRNGQFREEFLRQFGEALDGPLSVDRVDQLIDEMTEQLRPEIPRDRERWGSTTAIWESMVQRNKGYFHDFGDLDDFLIYSLRKYMGGTPEWEAWIAARQG